MKSRILAVLIVAGAAVAPFEAANAGPLTDALRDKLGTAVFLGKVAKGNLVNALRKGARKIACIRNVC